MPEPSCILIVAGDPSGDLHGAALTHALRRRKPGIRVIAMGGMHLRRAADRFIYPLVEVGGFGFWEPLLKLPKLWAAWRALRQAMREEKPSAVVPIDYYGFNIHVARLARNHQIPVVYFISPQIWASRPRRLKKLARVLNKMLVIFPFEESLYRSAGVAVRFVGHPLIDRLPPPVEPNGTLSIGLMPGSRWGTVERHLPIQIEAAAKLRETYPHAEFLLFRPTELVENLYRPFLAPVPWIHLVHDPEYQKRRKLSLAITVSGTAALENTLLGVPMIVMYKLSGLTYAIARRLIRVPFVAIPNILAGKPLVPELLQTEATPEKLAEAARALLQNADAARQMRTDLLTLRSQLGEPGATQRAAAEITQILEPA
jgi:lipid-A-disaccharide synthase